MNDNVVARWFGPGFAQLHPLLQSLHRHGGRLHGMVRIRTGRGPGAWAGARLAGKMGIPLAAEPVVFSVDIGHSPVALLWNRQFGEARLRSTFMPCGHWPDGYWIESIGKLQLLLTVDVIDGGWHRRCIGARLGALPVPRWLIPATSAWKRIEDSRYRFHVGIALPLLGTVLSYEGLLDLKQRPAT